MSEKPSVYLESSFISYLANDLSSDLIVAGQQKVTRDWWSKSRTDFELYASALVVEEISRGNREASNKRQEILRELTILEVTEEARKLALHYIEQKAIPVKAFDDAVHLAVTLLNGIDYLVSWNCKHIVNPVVERKVRSLNDVLGMQTPYICTPLGLPGSSNDE